MAKKQTRRTISVSRQLLERLRTYAETHGVAVAALAEFVLEQQLGKRLDGPAFDRWFAARAARLSALQRAAGEASRAPWSAPRVTGGLP